MLLLLHCCWPLTTYIILITLLSTTSTALQQTAYQSGVAALSAASRPASGSNTTYLDITALTASPVPPHHPQLTCLRLPTPFKTYPTTGSTVPLSLPLSSQRNMTLVTIPPKSTEGWHNPPMPMWFVLLRGKAVVTTYDPSDPHEEHLPITEPSVEGADDRSTEQLRQPSGGWQFMIGGEPSHANEKRQKVTIEIGSPNQFLLALDLFGRGHWTDYPSDEETWALQIPLAEGWEEEIWGWDVVGEGACT